MKILFHRGFHDDAFKVYDSIKNQHKDKTIYLTGHSLGGANGTRYFLSGIKRMVTSYRSTRLVPKIAVGGWWKFNVPHFRVVFETDPVPFVPPYPYKHSGIKINARDSGVG